MDFKFTDEQEAFRQEIRDFLKENLGDEWRGIDPDSYFHDENWPHIRELTAKLVNKGWLTLAWPEEYGGQARPHIEQMIYSEEMAYFRAPTRDASMGTDLVGPTVMIFGTEEQKAEYLPRIADGTAVYCQGFSEPESGSDLASLQLRAVEDGDDYILNGSKIWTSGAHRASHFYLMARTDPDAPKHRGISIFIFPMDTPGITVRPLWTIQNDPPAPIGTTYGQRRTNETFFEDVRVPATCMLGEENQGWYVGAMGLNLDRVGASRYLISVRRDEDIINWAKDNDLGGHDVSQDPAIRDRLAELWIEAQVCRLMTMRSMSLMERGDTFTYEGAAEKVWAPEHGVRTTETISQILGPYAQLMSTSEEAIEHGLFAHNLLGSFQSGINHGSVQVMRDQIARRGLGLPRG